MKLSAIVSRIGYFASKGMKLVVGAGSCRFWLLIVDPRKMNDSTDEIRGIMENQRGLICYELNEVPWRVLDYFCKKRPESFLAKNISKFGQLTTNTRDDGELHPWGTWPTMHRGIPNFKHDIRYINQDLSPAKQYPPVWQILSDHGIKCGIFGSLQSFPCLRGKNFLFHVPDTFAPEPDSFPRSAAVFQNFNLKMASRNKAEAKKIRVSDFLSGVQLLFVGISMASFLKAAKHLLNEKINPLFKARRPNLQAEFSFDVFFKLLRSKKPKFVTFFTNHVAGTMHRYWKYSFPEDFNILEQETQTEEFRFHGDSILKAMEISDRQIEKIYLWSQKHNYDLVIASSMGQEAIDRGEYIPELLVESIEPIAKLFGMEGKVRLNPAMQPDIALEFSNELELNEFTSKVKEIVDSQGKVIFNLRYQPKGCTLNLSVKHTKAATSEKRIYFGSKKMTLESLGLKLLSRDPGTGYHQPLGIVLWTGRDKNWNRETVDSCSFMPSLLKHFNVPRPNYCANSFDDLGSA